MKPKKTIRPEHKKQHAKNTVAPHAKRNCPARKT